MSNIIVRNDKENILKTAVSDPTMSRNARGMLLDLLYMESNASVKALTDMSSDGQYKVSSALKELESKGYLTCNRTRVNGKLADSNYVLTTPLPNLNNQELDNPIMSQPNMFQTDLVQPNLEYHNVVKTTENQGVCSTKTDSYNQDISMIDMIDNNIKNNNYIYLSNQSYQSSNLDSSSADVKSQVCYDTLVSEADNQDKDLIDLMANIMSEIYQSKSAWTRVSGQSMPTRKVITQFMKLGKDDLLYVIDCMNRTHTKIRSIKPYLIASLYNAAMTQDSRKLTENYNRREKQRQADSYCKRDELYDNFGESSFNIDEWREMAESYDPEKITFA